MGVVEPPGGTIEFIAVIPIQQESCVIPQRKPLDVYPSSVTELWHPTEPPHAASFGPKQSR